MLNLKRPLTIFDLETTGPNTKKDRIVEISVVKIFPNGEREARTRLINPTIPIPQEASNIHGITDDKVKDAPSFTSIAKDFYNQYILGCDIGGYNANRFDAPILYRELWLAGIRWEYFNTYFIDPCTIFKRKESRDLTSALKFYTGKDLVGAHGAEADTLATVEVLEAQFEKYPDLPQDIRALDKYSNYDNERVDLSGLLVLRGGQVLFNFGKNKDKPVMENLAYLEWMRQNDFPLDTIEAIDKIFSNG